MEIPRSEILAIAGAPDLYRWNLAAPLGTSIAVTFSFGQAKAAYDPVARNGYSAFSSAQQDSARAALAAWGANSGISFLEVPDAVGGSIRFGMTDMGEGSNSGYAYYPTSSWNSANGLDRGVGYDNLGGDVFINSRVYGGGVSMAPGERGFSLLLHEIGHALGFKHPFDSSPVIDPRFDDGVYTVLSYNRSSTTRDIGSLDTMAVQYYYGVTDIHTEFDAASLVVTRIGGAAGEWILGTELSDRLYGLDGADTLHGDRGDDALLGGPGADRLYGGDGNDTLTGESGDDVLHGGVGFDFATFGSPLWAYGLSGVGNRLIVTGPDGVDVLTSIEALRFGDDSYALAELWAASQVATLHFAWTNTGTGQSGNTVATSYSGPVLHLHFQYLGSAASEAVAGTAGHDFVNAGAGDDAISTFGGDDVLDGGLGSNFLTGGAGRDVFFADGRSLGSSWSTITDWEAGEQLSLWGWQPGISRSVWVEGEGAAGFTGATLHTDLDGNGLVETSVTWAGLTRAALPTPLEQSGLLWFT